VAIDAEGNAYLGGMTMSADFPTTPGSYQPDFGGEEGTGGAFVTKLAPSGSALVYSTYLGSSDEPMAIAVDASGSAYLAGTAFEPFPTTPGAFQTEVRGSDAYVTKFSPDGASLIYSTRLGGSSGDSAHGLAVDAAGNAYVAGDTSSTDFPTANAFQGVFGGGDNDIFVAKLDSAGATLLYSTFLGGTGTEVTSNAGNALSVDPTGHAVVTGETLSEDYPLLNAAQTARAGGSDVVVTRLDPTGSALVYSTLLGGGDVEYGWGITADGDGNTIVVGYTQSSTCPPLPAPCAPFPLVNAFQPIYGNDPVLGDPGLGNSYDGFVTKLGPAGNLVFSSFMGGSGHDFMYGAAVGAGGDIWVTGVTGSPNFPTAAALYPSNPNGIPWAFIARISDACQSATDCRSAPLCRRPDTGVCDVPTGTCQYPDIDVGAVCDDADPCTAPDQCDAAGNCQGGPNTCADGGTDAGADNGTDVGPDPGADPGTDGGADTGADPGGVEEGGPSDAADGGTDDLVGSCGCGSAATQCLPLAALLLLLARIRRRRIPR
jgi:hypothetical protein